MRATRASMALLLLAFAGLSTAPASAIDTHRTDVKSFIADMVQQYSFKKRALRKLLASAQSQPAILEAMDRPAEKAKLWYDYRPIYESASVSDTAAHRRQQ